MDVCAEQGIDSVPAANGGGAGSGGGSGGASGGLVAMIVILTIVVAVIIFVVVKYGRRLGKVEVDLESYAKVEDEADDKLASL